VTARAITAAKHTLLFPLKRKRQKRFPEFAKQSIEPIWQCEVTYRKYALKQ
jgi:hypothetical protein